MNIPARGEGSEEQGRRSIPGLDDNCGTGRDVPASNQAPLAPPSSPSEPAAQVAAIRERHLADEDSIDQIRLVYGSGRIAPAYAPAYAQAHADRATLLARLEAVGEEQKQAVRERTASCLIGANDVVVNLLKRAEQAEAEVQSLIRELRELRTTAGPGTEGAQT